jgi:hypothetical protein
MASANTYRAPRPAHAIRRRRAPDETAIGARSDGSFELQVIATSTIVESARRTRA